MERYTTNKWSYNRYFKVNKKIGKVIYSLPIFIMVVWYDILLVGLLVFNMKIPLMFVFVLSIASPLISLILKIKIDREILEKRTPIKVKITDNSLYFMSVSGKTKEIKIEDIEVVNLRKTLFDGVIVSIIERKGKEKVRYHQFYLSREIGEEIRRRHSKYVNYGSKVDN